MVDVDRQGTEWVRVITDDGQKGYVSADYVSIRSGEEEPSRGSSSASSAKGEEIVAYAEQFIGTPYVWAVSYTHLKMKSSSLPLREKQQ